LNYQNQEYLIGKSLIYKLLNSNKMILKELRETRVCLKIIIRKPLVDAQIVSPVLSENEELIAIFAKSSQTAKSKLPK
jgi:hypothetical protein